MKIVDKELDKIISKYDHVGLSVLHANPDGVDYLVNYGLSSLETKKPIENDTIYRIASISKVVVALCAMKLFEEGKLDIHEDISKYLGFKVRNPHFPLKPITTEMLMTQTSSLCDGNDDPICGYDGVNGPTIFVSLEDLLNNPDYVYYSPKTYLDAEPGTVWNYSNFGCGILACIIEKITNKLFTDYVKEVILDPLEIDGGYRIDQVEKKEKVAILYDYQNGEFVLERDLNLFEEKLFPKYPIGNNFRGPAGGLFISPLDLSKIMIMMMNKGSYNGIRILKEETISEMEKVHWRGISSDPSYKAKGLQLIILDGYSKEVLRGHFGCAYGLRSFMLYTRKNGYIFLCNGANYKEFAEHMVKMESDILKYLVKEYE